MNFRSRGNLMMTPIRTNTKISNELAKNDAISMIWTLWET